MGCGLEMENVITRKHIEKERKKKKFLDAGRSISRHHSKNKAKRKIKGQERRSFSQYFSIKSSFHSLFIYLFI